LQQFGSSRFLNSEQFITASFYELTQTNCLELVNWRNEVILYVTIYNPVRI
jgi:hypothetical protein